MSNASSNDIPPATNQTPCNQPRRKRRWWFYVGISLGALALLAVAVVVGLVMYWHSLVRNYSSTEPQPLPMVEGGESDLVAFQARWSAFVEAVAQGIARDSFQASATELNLLIAQNPDMKDRVRVVITNNQVLGRFTFPLDQAKQRDLKGRHLNGLARLNLDFQDGWLTVNVAELQANGKPIPRWILKKVQRENLAKDLDKNHEATAFLHSLESVAVEDDLIVLRPVGVD